MIKTAVIMDAGMGTRFCHYTDLIPKGFIPYKGKPRVIRSVETLIDSGIDKIIIGLKEAIKDEIQSDLVISVKYPNNPNWSFEKVHDYCYERGFTIYPGKISTTNTFRLCALGTIDVKDIEDFFVILKGALNHFSCNPQ